MLIFLNICIKQMKKVPETTKAIITVVMTCLSVLMTEETSQAEPMCGDVIFIVPRPDTPGAPRTPVVNPFIAELMDGNNSVLLGSKDNVGIVSVQITSMAGDNYSTYFNTSVGAILLPISGNAGYYILTIITPDGTHFVGEFTI